MSLLEDAEPISTRLKMYVYGASGTGKTITALHFPNVACIDTERGTQHYGKFFKFKRKFTSDPDVIISVINELLGNPVFGDTTIKTFVLDNITDVDSTILTNFENRMKIKTGNISYQVKPQDYKTINSIRKNIALKLLALDMNVIVTAKEKTKYAQGEFMQVEGVTADGPKDFPYLFDVVLRLSKTKEGKFWATVEKDRTNGLPLEFEYNYQSFVKYIGVEGLEREPVVFKQQENINQRSNRNVSTKFNGADIMTAGITGENISKIQELVSNFGQDKFSAKLKDDYLVDSVLDLKNDEAELLIEDINKILSEN